MARTTSASVIEILGANYGKLPDGTLPNLTPFIDTASSLVDKVVACAARKGVILSAVDQELIERWMSAHYYTQMDPLYASRATGGGSGSFRDQSYKNQALDLDSTGCLNAILNRKRAGVTWLGKTTDEMLTWQERNG